MHFRAYSRLLGNGCTNPTLGRTPDHDLHPAAPVYLETAAVGPALAACAKSDGDGHLRANFLNPFALETADNAKYALLERFEFVGSMASRHRLMSQIERDNYPGEEWVMLEI